MAQGFLDGLLMAARPLWQSPMILFFHGVDTGITDPRVQMLHMPRDRFVRLMTSLRRHHSVIGVDELADCLESGSPPPRNAVVLTFDDGYLNNLTVAAPIMQSLGLPWSVYVSTRHIDESLRFPSYIARAALYYTEKTEASLPGFSEKLSLRTEADRDAAYGGVSFLLKTSPLVGVEKLCVELQSLMPEDRWQELNHRFSSDQVMNWDQVRQLSQAGARIGAHCHDHAILHQAQGEGEVRRQVTLSQSLIARHVGECRHFVFPNGKPNDICPAALDAVRQAGFRTGMTTVPGFVTPSAAPLLLPRFSFQSMREMRYGCVRQRLSLLSGRRASSASIEE